MSYGIAKIGLERLTVDLAWQLAPDGIAVNCFRIDVAVASEGFVANAPSADHSGWEPCEVVAEGICWMIAQPASYTGRRESMAHLALRENIMPTVAARREPLPPTELFDGLLDERDTTSRSRTRDHGRGSRDIGAWSASAELGGRLPGHATKHRPGGEAGTEAGWRLAALTAPVTAASVTAVLLDLDDDDAVSALRISAACMGGDLRTLAGDDWRVQPGLFAVAGVYAARAAHRRRRAAVRQAHSNPLRRRCSGSHGTRPITTRRRRSCA